MRFLKRVELFFDLMIRYSTILAGFILIFVTLSVSAEVVLRYFIGRPTVWVVEIAGYSLLYMTFLVVAWVQRRQKHVKMDLIFNKLTPKVQSMVSFFASVISTFICFILTLYGVKVTFYFFKTGYPTPTPLRIPKYIIIFVIFLGSFLLLIQFIRTSYENWLNIKRAYMAKGNGILEKGSYR